MARPRDERIDDAVVAACVELLGEVGRARLTRAAIARRAGVSLPAVNRRYADVEAILLAVSRTPGRAPGAGGQPPRTLREHLVRTVAAMSAAFAEPGVRRAGAELLAAATGSADLDAAFGETLAGVREETLAWVRRAQEAGEVRDDVDPEVVVDLVTGAAYYRLIWRGEALAAADVEPLVDLVLDGVLARDRPGD